MVISKRLKSIDKQSDIQLTTEEQPYHDVSCADGIGSSENAI